MVTYKDANDLIDKIIELKDDLKKIDSISKKVSLNILEYLITKLFQII